LRPLNPVCNKIAFAKLIRKDTINPFLVSDYLTKSAASVASGCRFTTRILFRIMNRPAGFFSTSTSNAARAGASVRQIASVS
jgi:hypothetical protein